MIPTRTRGRRLVAYLDGSDHRVEDIGTKGLALNLLRRHRYPTPPAAIVTTAAYETALGADPLALLVRDLNTWSSPPPERTEAESAGIQRTFLSAKISDDINNAIDRIGSELLDAGPIALIVSPVATAAAAGCGDEPVVVTNLADLHVAIRRCWASPWMAATRTYRRRNHLPEATAAVAVILQVIVEPVWSGTAMTTDPDSEGHLIRVEALPGNPAQAGLAPARFLVRRDTLEIVPEPGTQHLEFVEALARMGLRVEQDLGGPQQIDWAMTQDGIKLLTTAPISKPPQPLGTDDGLDTPEPPDHTYTPHGVVEMIPGVAAPLLWTINRPMLEDAFRTTFADLGAQVPPEEQPIVARFRGRAALDLSAICDVTSSLPGGDPAEVQRQYLGEVLDAADSTPGRAHVATALKGRRIHKRIVDEVDLIAIAADGVVRMEIDLYDMPVRRLVAYRQRIRDLAWRGYASEVGASSAAGATYRALELLLQRWLPAEEAGSWTQMLTKGALDQSPVGGARARGLEQVLDRYATDSIRTEISGAGDGKRARIAQLGHDGTRFLEALDRAVRAMGSKTVYGDETWGEDESWVWRQLQLLTSSGRRPTTPTGWKDDFAALCRHLGTSKRWRRTRVITGQVVDLRVRWLRRQVQETIRFIELRERAKNALLVLGGEERRIIVEAARRLVASGQIPNPDAVRFLTDAELERMLFGQCGIGNDELGKRRRINHNCATAGPLPDWFVGEPAAHREVTVHESGHLEGWAASPGRYTGPVRIITSLADGTRLQPGEILVAHSTDPSWTPLFLVAGAVVLEVGGPLSHAAIVAREFGLPAVLNVRGSTRALNQGETVTVDGNEGRVERHDHRSVP